MRRMLFGIATAVLALAAAILTFVGPAHAAAGLHISGRAIVEANGQTFVMRGVNHPHVWYTSQTSSFANVKALGANTIRVVLGSGKRWGPSTDVADVILRCKQNKLICVLEVHDTTGYPDETAGAATLDEAADYWISQKSALVGQENYVVVNIGNEPIGNQNPTQWIDATANAVKKLRANGLEHLLMVDAPNWGQDWTNTMRDNAQRVWDADNLHNTVFSVHMYSVYNTAASIASYFDAFASKGLPLVVGEFGWRFNATEVDHETILAETRSRGIGYLAWSWSGNSDPILDMATTFDPNQLTTWGQIIFNGPNGIKATAKEAAIFAGAPTSPSGSTPPTTPTTTPPVGSAGCAATYTVVGQWQGGFQAEVRITARDTAIRGWTVTWTFGNGQTVSNAWNATVTSTGSGVTARNMSYNGNLGAQASTTFGFLGTWNGANGAPTLACTAN